MGMRKKRIRKIGLLETAPIALTLAVLLAYLSVTVDLSNNGFPGITYGEVQLADPRRTLHVIAINRHQVPGTYQLFSSLGRDGLYNRDTLSHILTHVRLAEGVKPIAAVTGTFTGPRGFLRGSLRGPYGVHERILLSSTMRPTWPSIAIHRDGSISLDDVVTQAYLTLADRSRVEVRFNEPVNQRSAVIYTPDAGGVPASALIPVAPAESRNFLLSTYQSLDGNIPLSRSPQATPRLLLIEKEISESSFVLEKGSLIFSVGSELASNITQDPNVLAPGQLIELVTGLKSEQRYGLCSLPITSNQKSSLETLTSGGRVLVYRDPQGVKIPISVERANTIRDPLSGLCWTDQQLYMVVADGFRPGVLGFIQHMLGFSSSAGMTVSEMASYMKHELACECGIELDGGKSATMFYKDRIVNSPATGREHPINAPIILGQAT